MDIILSEKSFHARLYQSSYGEYLPDNLCIYFWKTLLAFILMIPASPGHLINLISKKYNVHAIWFSLHVILALMLGLGRYEKEEMKYVTGWNLYLWGLLFIGIFCALVCFAGAMFYFKDKYRDMKRTQKIQFLKEQYPDAPEWKIMEMIKKKRKINLIVEWIKAFKGKYCPKLQWHE